MSRYRTDYFTKNIARSLLRLFAITGTIAVLSSMAAAQAPIWDVSLDAGSASFVRGEQVKLVFDTNADEPFNVSVYDPDGGLVKKSLAFEKKGPTKYSATWNGLDEEGKIVPDEAYTFVIESAGGEYHDPFTESGGEVNDITRVKPDTGGAFTYKLPQAARVLIRLGIKNGPMLRTLVDWDPRVSGNIREPWNGFDQDGLQDLRGKENFSLLITYVTLPDATVTAYGNKDENYRDYKLGRGKGRPQKTQRPKALARSVSFTPTGLVPRAWSRAPQVTLRYPAHDSEVEASGVPTANGFIDSVINVADEDRPALESDQYEVMLYMDNEMVAEAERGYLPLRWRWDLSNLSPGEHILTVNIASFKGQVGVKSRKIIVAE